MTGVPAIRRSLNVVGFAFIILTALGTTSHADLYHFACITNNNPVAAAAGEDQLTVDVTSVTGRPDQTLFVFQNEGPAASSITDIYFDDGTLLGIAQVFNYGLGVSFTQNMPGNKVSPGNLPGGANLNPPFEAVADFSADSNPPVQPMGVNPGESVGILFNLQSGGSFATVISELASGELRIGIKVQGFAGGYSEGFVNTPPEPPVPPTVPLPGAVLLGSMGLGVAGWRLRGKKEFV